MSPAAHQLKMNKASQEQTEAIARVEAEQARQAVVLAAIVERLDALMADRSKRSPVK